MVVLFGLKCGNNKLWPPDETPHTIPLHNCNSEHASDITQLRLNINFICSRHTAFKAIHEISFCLELINCMETDLKALSLYKWLSSFLFFCPPEAKMSNYSSLSLLRLHQSCQSRFEAFKNSGIMLKFLNNLCSTNYWLVNL